MSRVTSEDGSAIADDELASQGSRPWSEATFGGCTNFEIQHQADHERGLELPEPPEVPPAEPSPPELAAPSPLEAPEEMELDEGTSPKPRRKKRLMRRRRAAADCPKEVLDASNEAPRRLEQLVATVLDGQAAQFEAAKRRLEALCTAELEHLQHTLAAAVRELEPECADFTSLEEVQLAPRGGASGPVPAVGLPVLLASFQVNLQEAGEVEQAARSELLSSAKMDTAHGKCSCREKLQTFFASKTYAIAAQLLTLLSMAVIWLDTEFARQPWVAALSWACTAAFTLELLQIAAFGKECLTSDSKWWSFYDLVIVLLAWIDELYIVTTSSGLPVLRALRVLRVARLFRFCQPLHSWASAAVECTRALFWSTMVMALALFAASICITTICAEWIKNQVDFENPSWPDLLDQKNAMVLIDKDQSELVMSVWAWFGSLPRCSYTLLQCSWGVSWGQQSDALLEVGYPAVGLFLLYLLMMFIVIFNVVLGLVVDAVAESCRMVQEPSQESIPNNFVSQMRNVFDVIDTNADNVLDPDEVANISDKASKAAQTLGVDGSELSVLLAILAGKSRAVSFADFVAGAWFLKHASTRPRSSKLQSLNA